MKQDFIRTPDGNQRIIESNIKVRDYFSIPVFEDEPTLNDNVDEAGPIAINSEGKFIFYDGTAWQQAGGAPAGDNGQIQFNNEGVFGASENLHWDDVNKRLGIGSQSTTPGATLSIIEDIPADEMGMHIKNTNSTGYSVLRLGTDVAAPTGAALHYFNAAWSGTGPYTPTAFAFAAYGAYGMSLISASDAETSNIGFYVGGDNVSDLRFDISQDNIRTWHNFVFKNSAGDGNEDTIIQRPSTSAGGKALRIISDIEGDPGTLDIQNTSSGGNSFSAINYLDIDGNYRMSMGFGNTTFDAFAGAAFIEANNLTGENSIPVDFNFVQTGTDGDGGYLTSVRTRYKGFGDLEFYGCIPGTHFANKAMIINSDGFIDILNNLSIDGNVSASYFITSDLAKTDFGSMGISAPDSIFTSTAYVYGFNTVTNEIVANVNRHTTDAVLPNNSYSTFYVGGSSFSSSNSGIHNWFSELVIGTPSLHTQGSARIVNAANVYIKAAPTFAENNYSLYVEGGSYMQDVGLQNLIITDAAYIAAHGSIPNDSGTESLQMYSTTKAFLPPSVNVDQMNAMEPQIGGQVYNNQYLRPIFYNGTDWKLGAFVDDIEGQYVPYTGGVHDIDNHLHDFYIQDIYARDIYGSHFFVDNGGIVFAPDGIGTGDQIQHANVGAHGGMNFVVNGQAYANISYNFGLTLRKDILFGFAGSTNPADASGPDIALSYYSSTGFAVGTDVGLTNRDMHMRGIYTNSTTVGSIPAPVMSSSQIAAMSSPVKGWQAFSNDNNAPFYFDGTSWIEIVGNNTDATLLSLHVNSTTSFSRPFPSMTELQSQTIVSDIGVTEGEMYYDNDTFHRPWIFDGTIFQPLMYLNDLSSYQLLGEKNVANGYVGLNSSAKIDATYLPSYVSDIVTVANFAALPGTGTPGFIYITIDTEFEYRWNAGTSSYIRLVASPGTTDALAEGSTNLYYHDALVATYGNTVYPQLSSSYANPTWITSLAWAKISTTPTSISGYGITNAYTKTEVDGAISALSGIYQPLENQRVSTTDDVTFDNIAQTGIFVGGALNLDGFDFSPYYSPTTLNGRLLIGSNKTGSQCETDFINLINNDGSGIGGFRFSKMDVAGTETFMMQLHGDTLNASFAARIAPGIMDLRETTPTGYLTYDEATNSIETRNVGDMFGDFVSAITSGTLITGDTLITVNIGGTFYQLVAILET